MGCTCIMAPVNFGLICIKIGRPKVLNRDLFLHVLLGAPSINEKVVLGYTCKIVILFNRNRGGKGEEVCE